MPAHQDKLACRKADCRFLDLVQKAERELALLDLQLVDDAEDAAFLGSNLSLRQTEDVSRVETCLPAVEVPTDREFDPAEPSASLGDLKRKREEADVSPALPSFEASSEKIPSPGSSENVPLTRQQRRNRLRRGDRKAKAASVQSKRRALYRKAELVALELDPTSLPHSSQGYIGPTASPKSESVAEDESVHEGPLPAGVDYLSHPRLLNLVRSGYSVVPSSTEPSLFLDQDNRIIGWRVGIMGGAGNEARWDEQNADLTASLETLARNMENRQASAPGVPRGEHSWAHWGYSYGGGERRPTSRQQTKQERTWWGHFLDQPAYINTTQTILDSWKTWAPNVLSDYTQCHQDILERLPTLDRVHGADPDSILPFASLTANLGPQTVCQAHRDIKNKASGGICGIKTLGPYNWQLGGHIVLHELGLVVEMRPGDIIFFPSAVITHETIPVSPDEKRYSLVWYSAGGLFRWCDADFQSLRNWATQDPTAYNAHQEKGETRWTNGWKNFSTLSELVVQSERISAAL
ncbi:hypothetical protein FRC04_010543 [Tulasnella sp. 424]|nr:hypothetical protein FRC04_010543 [Tulasnella sp. 424]